MIFLEFTGICTFSLITGNITNLKEIKQITEIIDEKVILLEFIYNILKSDEIENYLCEIDVSIPNKDMTP